MTTTPSPASSRRTPRGVPVVHGIRRRSLAAGRLGHQLLARPASAALEYLHVLREALAHAAASADGQPREQRTTGSTQSIRSSHHAADQCCTRCAVAAGPDRPARRHHHVPLLGTSRRFRHDRRQVVHRGLRGVLPSLRASASARRPAGRTPATNRGCQADCPSPLLKARHVRRSERDKRRDQAVGPQGMPGLPACGSGRERLVRFGTRCSGSSGHAAYVDSLAGRLTAVPGSRMQETG